jgi:spore germination protein GerM
MNRWTARSRRNHDTHQLTDRSAHRLTDRRALGSAHRSTARGLASALPVVVLALLAGCATDDPVQETPTAVEPAETDTPAEPTPEVTEPADTVTVMVYYPIDTRTGFRLAREPREVPDSPSMAGVVETMIAGPDDPDYGAVWNPSTQVNDVTVADGVITVDLSADARTANVGSALAGLMIDQLVYTVTDAAEDPSLAVMLTIDGEPAGALWGAVVWDEPVTRADPMDVRLLVQIDNLAEGAVVSSPVTVSGEAAVFEATLLWKVLDADGAEVAAGFATTSEGQTFAPYAFDVELDPGTYTVVITEDDPSDGEGGESMTDTRTITVT